MLDRDQSDAEAFASAWQKIRAGRSIESVLEEYPDHTAEMEPMLRLADAMRALPAPPLKLEALEKASRAALTEARKRRKREFPVLIAFPTPARTNPVDRKQSRLRRALSGVRSFSSGRLSAGVAILALLVAVVALFAALLYRNSANTGGLETYTGTITRITTNGWIVDDTEIFVDKYTEVHGRPQLGSEVTCITEPYPPGERAHALEVWVRTQPETAPTHTPFGPSSLRADPPTSAQGSNSPAPGN